MNNLNLYREGITKYLHENFIKPKLGLISKLLGEREVYQHEIVKLEEYSDSDNFKEFKLIWVYVKEYYLNFNIRSSLGSYGLFAVNEHDCVYLGKNQYENLKYFLKQENNITKIPAKTLANLFCNTYMGSWGKVVEETNDIYSIAKKDAGYELDQNITLKPCSIINETNKFILKFNTLNSWRLANNSINETTVEITKDFDFKISENVLFKRAFSKMPALKLY